MVFGTRKVLFWGGGGGVGQGPIKRCKKIGKEGRGTDAPFFSFFFFSVPCLYLCPPPLLLLLLVLVFVTTPLARSLAGRNTRTKTQLTPFCCSSQPGSKASKQRSCVVLGHLGSICHLCAQIKHVCILQKH